MIAPLGPPTPEAPASSLVGREREQAALRAVLQSALAGRGSLVLIGGEAGVGKTVLAEALLAEAQARGALVLVGWCYDLSETPPFGPWIEALAHFGPAADLPPALRDTPQPDATTAANPAALFRQAREFLSAVATNRPLVLLLEDLHWADLASLDLLRALGRGLGQLPILVLATYRSDELTRRHPLYALLPTLEREAHAARLDLRAFSVVAVAALVAAHCALPSGDRDRLVAWLLARAEGNAFFTAQLLRSLEDTGALAETATGWSLADLGTVGLPAPLRQLLDARIDRLGNTARELLALAAVIGQEVPLATWATVAGTDEDGLLETIERAVETHLLAALPAGDAVRFAHALIREALYEGILPIRRRRLHRLVGEALAATASPDPDAVASHFQRAGDPRAAMWLIRAGERAQRSFALATAAARYQAAFAFLPDDDDHAGERGWLLTRIGNALRYVDQPQAVAAYAEARALGLRSGDRALAALALCDHGVFRSNLNERRQGLTDVTAGIAEMAALPPEEQARLDRLASTGQVAILPHRRRGLLWLLAHAGRYPEVLALAEECVERDVPAERAWATGHADACHGLGIAHAMLGHPDEARRWLAEGQRGFFAVGHPTMGSWLMACELWFVALVAAPDRLAERERLAQVALSAAVQALEAGGFSGEPNVNVVPLWFVDGRWTEARAALLAVLRPGPNRGGRDPARAYLGWLAYLQGEADLAREQVRAVFPDGPQPASMDAFVPAVPPLVRLAAALALDDGDLTEARRWLETHDQWLAWSGTVVGLAEGALGWAAYQRATGDAGLAREHAQTALAHASAPRQPLALLAAHRLLGEFDTVEGRHADAAAHFDAALVLAGACAAPYERALTLLALAELRVAEGQANEATVALAAARALLAPLEARPALARADALAARIDPPPPPRAPRVAAYPAGLTEREVDVLRLLAQGLPNAQIAAHGRAAPAVHLHQARRHLPRRRHRLRHRPRPALRATRDASSNAE